MSTYIVKIICTLENHCYANGTGFFCSQNGHVLTCAHNVVNTASIKVYYKRQIYEATVISLDNRIDIAILKITEVTPCPKMSTILQYGVCYTYSYHHDHLCLSYQTGSIMSLNYISKYAIDSTLTTIKGFKGASGSPIFNTQNEVMGVFSYESNIGCGGVILSLLQQYLNNVNYSLKYVTVPRSHTGFITKPLSIDYIIDNNIEYLYKNVRGELVTKILRKKTCICQNDVIVSVNKNSVGAGFFSSECYVLYNKPNTNIQIEYLCASKKYELKSCIIKTIDFPNEYDKPLNDTTIFKHH